MYNELFESVIRTSGENTDDIDDFDDRDNFWAPTPENLLFEQVLREMSKNFSKPTGRNYVSIVDRKKKNNEDVWSDNSIDHSVSETLSLGLKGDGRFVLEYTKEEENAGPAKTTMWFTNLKNTIQYGLKDIIPLNKDKKPDFSYIKKIIDTFMRHLKLHLQN